MRRGMRRAGSAGMSGVKKIYRAWQNLGNDERTHRRSEYGRGMDKHTGQWQRGQTGSAARAASAAVGSGYKTDGVSAQHRKGASDKASEGGRYVASASGVYANSRGLLDEREKYENQDKGNLKDKGIAKRRMAMQQNGGMRRLSRTGKSNESKTSVQGMASHIPIVRSAHRSSMEQSYLGHMQRPMVTGKNQNGSIQRPLASVKRQATDRQRPVAGMGQEVSQQRPSVSGKVQNHYAQQIVRSDRPFVNRQVIRRMAPSDLVDIKQVRVKQGAFKAAHTAGREFLKMDKKDTMDWVLNGGKTAGKDKNRR